MIYIENAHKGLSDGGMGVCVYLGVVSNSGTVRAYLETRN